MHTKFIFVTGGVVSSLGKGITAASLGRLLKSRGLRVSMQKFDPYINVDPGTMSPYQHGEVFVTDDGAETDLDLGHYERFIDENLTQAANVTSGRVYDTVITRERKGEYLGATIQVIPHITDEIKRRMLAVSLREDAPDVVITEIGGTVGDIESLPFLEAARQLKNEVGRENVLYIHVTLVPYISAAGELKTKPTQHSVKELTGLGIQPDIIVCRSEKALTRDVRAKIGLFCNIPADCVFENLNARSIYEVPLMIHEEGMDERVCRLLGIPAPEADLTEWRGMVERLLTPERDVRIAIVGKYVELPDAYLSIVEALTHGGIAHHAKVRVEWVAAESVTPENAAEKLAGCGGVLVPGGFGERGLEGKIAAVQYAREHGVPFFGICLGMQLLFEKSYEFGEHQGLGLIPGEIVPMQGTIPADLKIPQIGWNRLQLKGESPLFQHIQDGDYVYFVHSYYASGCDPYVIATTDYGIEMTAAAAHGNVYGCQFHPEKSGPVGLKILAAFCETEAVQ